MNTRRAEKNSFATGAVMTILIVLMLIFSGPAQAVRVIINTDELNGKLVGETGYFFVNVTIGANERIPVTNISLEGLPGIQGSPDGSLVFNVSDLVREGDHIVKGRYDISLVSMHGWVGGYGYGYGYENSSDSPPYSGYGYGHDFGYGYGYGYGYGSGYGYGYGYGYPGTYTSLRYKIAVDTTGAMPGNYLVKAILNTGTEVQYQGESGFTLVPDITPPGGISNLHNVTYAEDNVNWTWTDPADEDFDHIEVNINGVFMENVRPGQEYFNLTGLAPDSEYEIGTRTSDRSGNVNSTWVNHTARTAPIHISIKIKDHVSLKKKEIKVTIFNNTPPGFDVAGINISSVTFGPLGAVPYENDTKDEDLILSFRTEETGIVCGDATATLTGLTNSGTRFVGSDSFETKGCGPEKNPESGSSSSGGGSSGGGGGGASDEDYSNIELKERHEGYIYKDTYTLYRFTDPLNPVSAIEIAGNFNAGDITTTIEVLRGTSKLVGKRSQGTIYKNLNFWVGQAGFATSKNIKDAVIRFRVENKWLEKNDLVGSDIRLERWDGYEWRSLQTTEKSRDDTYAYFESRTNAFSPFVITGLKDEISSDTKPLISEEVTDDGAVAGDEKRTGNEPSGGSAFSLTLSVILTIFFAMVLLLFAIIRDTRKP